MKREAARLKSIPTHKITVREWLTLYREFFPTNRKRATIEHDARMLKPFIRAYGSKPFRLITPLMAQEWTIKNPGQVRYLRHAWERAVAMGIAESNPWEHVQMPPRNKPRREAPTLKQLDAALGRARAMGGWWLEYADLVEIAAFTGLRRGGVVNLRRSKVDVQRRRLTVTEKGGKTRTVVMPTRARDAMASQLARHPWTPYVFAAKGVPIRPIPEQTVSAPWRQIRGDFPGPFHSLRHFAASWLLAQGVTREDIAVQLGHVDDAGRPYTELVDRVYAHVDHEQVFERIEKVLS